MPSIDTSLFATIANQLITDFGGPAILTRKPPGTYDPNTSQAAVVPTTQNIIAVTFPYPERLIDGTMIVVGDLQAFVSPNGVTDDPKPADKFTYFGKDYIVINVKDYKVAGVPVLYELQVRK